MFIFSFSQATLYSAFPIFCNDILGFTAEKVGILFVYLGMIAIIIQGGLMKSLTKKFRETSLFFAGNIFLLIGLSLLPFAKNMPQLLIFLGIMNIGASLNMPVLNSLISKEVDPAQFGTALGAAQGIGSLGRVIGPTWGGYLYHYDFHVPFLGTALFVAFSLYVAWIIKRDLN